MGFRFLFCYFSFSDTHTHVFADSLRPSRQDKRLCLCVADTAAVGDGSSREESSYGSPRASLSRLKARGASLPFQSPVTHQPESPSTPVINTEPCFLFHSNILAMTQTFNG